MNLKNKFAEAGFTLIEVMIAVVIVAILAAIAVPNYTEYVRRGNRAEAAAALLESAARMQQHFTLSNSYVGTVGFKNSSRYTVTPAVDATASTFTLQAAPNAGVNDPKCGTFTIDQSGLRGMTGTFTGTAADCWAGK